MKMGDGTRENPYTREDVLKLIEENGGKAKGLDLSGKVFKRGIDLSELDLEGIILSDAVLGYANFKGARLWEVHFEGAHLDFAHFEGAELYFAHLSGAILWFAEFALDTKLEHIDWGSYILGEEKNGNFPAAQITYRRLKIWHTNAGMYDIAAEFYYREMETKRKFAQEQIHKLFKEYKVWQFLRFLFKERDFGNWLRLWLYRLTCGYGERPWRVVAWGLLVLFGLALVYFLLRGVAPYTLTVQAFWSSLYYSAVSFTALGYGPWFSAGSVRSWAQGLGAAEAIIGVFTIALFLITFVRKMTR